MSGRRRYNYFLVDVFTSVAFGGNALAVFPDAAGLDGTMMQAIARELNLSETAFVLAPGGSADLRVRIFTPAHEMRFAGHPTIGTAFVARRTGLVSAAATQLVLEEPIGPVTVRVDDRERFWLQTPPIRWGETFEKARAAAALGLSESDVHATIPVMLVSAGNPCAYVTLRSVAAVDRISIDRNAFRTLFSSRDEPTCLFAFAVTPDGAYARMFSEEFAIVEDPATGSATGPLAAFMIEFGLASFASGTTFVSEQGTKMGRRSFLHVRVDGERGARTIHVGGDVVPIAEATIVLDEP